MTWLSYMHQPARHSTWIDVLNNIYPQISSSFFNQTLTPKTHVLSYSFTGTTHYKTKGSIKNLVSSQIAITHQPQTNLQTWSLILFLLHHHRRHLHFPTKHQSETQKSKCEPPNKGQVDKKTHFLLLISGVTVIFLLVVLPILLLHWKRRKKAIERTR